MNPDLSKILEKEIEKINVFKKEDEYRVRYKISCNNEIKTLIAEIRYGKTIVLCHDLRSVKKIKKEEGGLLILLDDGLVMIVKNECYQSIGHCRVHYSDSSGLNFDYRGENVCFRECDFINILVKEGYIKYTAEMQRGGYSVFVLDGKIYWKYGDGGYVICPIIKGRPSGIISEIEGLSSDCGWALWTQKAKIKRDRLEIGEDEEYVR